MRAEAKKRRRPRVSLEAPFLSRGIHGTYSESIAREVGAPTKSLDLAAKVLLDGSMCGCRSASIRYPEREGVRFRSTDKTRVAIFDSKLGR
jgi:hypothetical protein